MRRNKVIWGLSLGLLGGLWLWSGSYVLALVLGMALLVPVLCILLVKLRPYHPHLQLKLPALLQQGAAGSLHITLQGSWCAGRIMILLRYKNLYTEQTGREHFIVSPGRTGSWEREIHTWMPGPYSVRMDEIILQDIFGITAKHIKLPAGQRTFILPALLSTQVTIANRPLWDPESAEYSAYQAGRDSSETFAIKDYEKGDSLKQIHWKLSSKFGHLMLKQPSLPESHSLALLLETGGPAFGQTDEQEREALARIYFTIAQQLFEQQLSCDLLWWEEADQMLKRQSVDSFEAAAPYWGRIFTAGRSDISLAAAYQQASTGNLTHLIYVAAEPPRIVNGDYWSTVICRRGQAAELSETENQQVVATSPEHYETALHYLAI